MNYEEENENQNSNTSWPDAVLGIGFFLLIAFICFGNRILDAILK